MEKVKVSKTFHYRINGEWKTVQAGSIVKKDDVPSAKLQFVTNIKESDTLVELPKEEKKVEPTKPTRTKKGILG